MLSAGGYSYPHDRKGGGLAVLTLGGWKETLPFQIVFPHSPEVTNLAEPLELFDNSIFPVANMKQDDGAVPSRSYLGTNIRPHCARVDAELVRPCLVVLFF